jgi:hypothetical protein
MKKKLIWILFIEHLQTTYCVTSAGDTKEEVDGVIAHSPVSHLLERLRWEYVSLKPA